MKCEKNYKIDYFLNVLFACLEAFVLFVMKQYPRKVKLKQESQQGRGALLYKGGKDKLANSFLSEG